jgi:glycosyltransferase 2 family protein
MKKNHLYFLLRVTITILIVWWVLKKFSIEEGLPFISAAPWWVFIVPALVILTNTIIHTLRLWILFKASGHHLYFYWILISILKGQFVGLILPMGGGEIAKIGFLSQYHESTTLVTAIMTIARALELVPWGLVLLFGSYFIMDDHSQYAYIGSLIGCGLLAISIFVFAASFYDPSHLEWVPNKLFELYSRVKPGLLKLQDKPTDVLNVLILGCSFVVMNTLCVWAICLGYKVPISWFDIFCIFPIVDSIISLPISINGIGLRELIYQDIFALFEIGPTEAVAIAWTRWSADIVRAALGGIFFLFGRKAFHKYTING